MTARRASVRRRLRRKRRHKDWRLRAALLAGLHLRAFELQRDLRAQGMPSATAHVEAAQGTVWRKLVRTARDMASRYAMVFEGDKYGGHRSRGMEESK